MSSLSCPRMETQQIKCRAESSHSHAYCVQVTPLHHDPHHNVLAQVVGLKYVRLYPPSATRRLYPFQEGLTTNASQVDLAAPDLIRYPDFEGLPHQETLLQPGEMLYIPPGWWHYVQSLSVSFSVSFWWS